MEDENFYVTSLSVEELAQWLKEQGIPEDFCKIFKGNKV